MSVFVEESGFLRCCPKIAMHVGADFMRIVPILIMRKQHHLVGMLPKDIHEIWLDDRFDGILEYKLDLTPPSGWTFITMFKYLGTF